MEGVDLAEFERAVDLNIRTVLVTTEAAIPQLRKRGGGALLYTASVAGITGSAFSPIYSAVKFGVVGFVRAIAPQLDPVRINAICPGYVDTSMVDFERESIAERGIPLLAPADVAEAMWLSVTAGRSGECWFVQPGRPSEPFRFPRLPGPRG